MRPDHLRCRQSQANKNGLLARRTSIPREAFGSDRLHGLTAQSRNMLPVQVYQRATGALPCSLPMRCWVAISQALTALTNT